MQPVLQKNIFDAWLDESVDADLWLWRAEYIDILEYNILPQFGNNIFFISFEIKQKNTKIHNHTILFTQNE